MLRGTGRFLRTRSCPPASATAEEAADKDVGQKTPGGGAIRDPENSPGGASTTFTRTPKPEKSNQLQRLKPRLANTPCGRIKQSRLQPIPMAGFEVTTEFSDGDIYRLIRTARPIPTIRSGGT
jgi:hypothetical protein